MGSLNEKMRSLNRSMSPLNEKMRPLNRSMSALNQKMGPLNRSMSALNEKMGPLNRSMSPYLASMEKYPGSMRPRPGIAATKAKTGLQWRVVISSEASPGRVDKLRASTERGRWWMRGAYPPYRLASMRPYPGSMRPRPGIAATKAKKGDRFDSAFLVPTLCVGMHTGKTNGFLACLRIPGRYGTLIRLRGSQGVGRVKSGNVAAFLPTAYP
uniref:Uncharacterized protein n=1 Tax=Candidatus Kentrum sp. DK TaxID=2126562 RepID=A0A450SS75_9GAMM|nr:MAG: hypothetical protein BECKDK2373C_GA0170839_10569 [Candidatus Kentron sp. DK]